MGSANFISMLLFFSILILLFGCLAPAPYENSLSMERRAQGACIKACNALKASGANMSAGPCAANPLKDYPSWVCDVAHNPRQPVDDIIDNQCSLYQNGGASYFIEVTPECEFIRSN
ncbi:Uncharacterised protein [Candidatus Anstonella stagnisolia]|nr:Uncharacterised protein [Candidatus Anstonella stagnisolia]